MRGCLLELIGFMILVQLAVSTNATHTCSQVERNLQATYLADPNDCGQFIVCVHGVAVSMRCPKGLHWNRLALTCDYPTRAKCKISHSIEMETKAVAAVKEPQSLINEDIQEICAENIAAEKVSDMMLPHPKDCTKFLKCSNGRLWIFKCPKGFRWNAANRRCDCPFTTKNVISERKDNLCRNEDMGKPETVDGLENFPKSSNVNVHQQELTNFNNFEHAIINPIHAITEVSKDMEWLSIFVNNKTTNAPPHDNSDIATTKEKEIFVMTEYKDSRKDLPDTSYNINSTTEASRSWKMITELMYDAITNESYIVDSDIKTKAEENTLENQHDETQTTTDLTTGATISKIEEKAPQFENDVTTNDHIINNPESNNSKPKEKSILSESEESSTKHPEIRQTEIKFTLQAEMKSSQTNIGRSITETSEITKIKTSSTPWNTKQTTATPMTTLPQLTKTSLTTFSSHNFISLGNQKEPRREVELKREMTTESNQKVKVLTAANSFPLFDSTSLSEGALPMPLSKTAIERLYSSNSNVNGKPEIAEYPRISTEKNNIKEEYSESFASFTIDPYQPYKAVECEGIDNEERFVSSDCRKYFQCHRGYAYQLNCFDGYVFNLDRKICIRSDEFCIN